MSLVSRPETSAADDEATVDCVGPSSVRHEWVGSTCVGVAYHPSIRSFSGVRGTKKGVMVTSIDGREGFWDWQDRVMASLGFNHTIESLLNSTGRGTWKVGMVGG